MLKVSQKLEYAIRAMIELAEHRDDETLTPRGVNGPHTALLQIDRRRAGEWQDAAGTEEG